MAETISYVYIEGPWMPEDIQLLNERGRYHHHLAYIRPYQEELSGLAQPGYLLSFRYAARTDADTDPVLGAFGLFSRYDRETFQATMDALADPGAAPVPTGGRQTGGGGATTPADPKPAAVSGLTTDGSTISASDSAAATFFHVQVAADNAFTDTVANYHGASGTSHSVKVVLTDGVYYRARFTSKALGTGTAGDWTSAALYDIPDLPTGVTVPSGQNIAVAANAGAYYLHVQLASDATFSSPSNYYGGSTSVRSVSTGTLSDNTYYRARFTTAASGRGIAGPWTEPALYRQTPRTPGALSFSPG